MNITANYFSILDHIGQFIYENSTKSYSRHPMMVSSKIAEKKYFQHLYQHVSPYSTVVLFWFTKELQEELNVSLSLPLDSSQIKGKQRSADNNHVIICFPIVQILYEKSTKKLYPTFSVSFPELLDGFIYNCDKEIFPTFILEYLLLFNSSVIFVY